MFTRQFALSVSIPSLDEFGKQFPQYKPFASGEGAKLFNSLLTPSSFNSAVEVTKIGLPAVTGIAESSIQEIKSLGREPTRFDKQFIGGVICSLMEANGYSKTGKKRAISHEAFSKGEFYEPTKG